MRPLSFCETQSETYHCLVNKYCRKVLFCKQAQVSYIFQGSHGKSYCILKLVIFGEKEVKCVLIPVCVNCFDIHGQ